MTTGQLLAAGLSHQNIGNRVRSGRLHRLHRGVYAVGHTAPSVRREWLAAVLAAGDGAVLARRCAIALRGWWRYAVPTAAEVLVPRRHHGLVALDIRSTRSLRPEEIVRIDSIAVTSVARTLVDLADGIDVGTLTQLVSEAAFHDLLDRAALERCIERHRARPGRGHHRRRGAYAAFLHGSTGTRSRNEERFARVISRSHLPQQVAGMTRSIPGGKPITPDFTWPRERLVVEIDDVGHLQPDKQRADKRRDRRLRAAGWRVHRIWADLLWAGDDEVVRIVERELATAAAAAAP